MKATIWATAALITIGFTIALAAFTFEESFAKGQAIILTGSSLTITMTLLALVNIMREWRNN